MAAAQVQQPQMAEPEPVPEPEPEPIPAPVQYEQEAMPAVAPPLAHQQPDVIPLQRESVQSEIYETVAPPPAFGNGVATENVPEPEHSVPNAVADEQIYSNVNYAQEPIGQENVVVAEAEQINPSALTGNEDCNLSDYIEDTKIQAIALYDYQASAEDEISFDPNDIISHIEKVSIDFHLDFVRNCTMTILLISSNIFR